MKIKFFLKSNLVKNKQPSYAKKSTTKKHFEPICLDKFSQYILKRWICGFSWRSYTDFNPGFLMSYPGQLRSIWTRIRMTAVVECIFLRTKEYIIYIERRTAIRFQSLFSSRHYIQLKSGGFFNTLCVFYVNFIYIIYMNYLLYPNSGRIASRMQKRHLAFQDLFLN